MPSKKHRNQTDIKGKLLEQIVAALHEHPEVEVHRNVRLPSVGNAKRKREIDVLLVGNVGGYPIRIAIECKNYRKKIGSPNIDAFVGKLKDIGIPPQCGVYVASTGFTSGAIERAEKDGIRTLILAGITTNGLRSIIFEAVQSVLYILPVIKYLHLPTNLGGQRSAVEDLTLFDEKQRFVGTVNDIIWIAWMEGKIAPKIGETTITLQVPKNLTRIVQGNKDTLEEFEVTLLLLGISLLIPGEVTNYSLVDTIRNKMERFQTTARFQVTSSTFPVFTFFSEKEVDSFLASRSESLVVSVGRYKLPRIRANFCYWPPSERVLSLLAKRKAKNDLSGTENLSDLEFGIIEGTDLRTVWEPLVPNSQMVAEFLNRIVADQIENTEDAQKRRNI